MYKVVEKDNIHAVYAQGYSRQKLQHYIDTGYFHKYLPAELQNVELMVIEIA